MLGETLLCFKMTDFLNIFAALEQGDCETISCTILDSNDDVILLAGCSCLLYAEGINSCKWVLRSNYSSVFVEGVRKPVKTSETCQLLTQELITLGGIQLAIHLGGPQFCQKKQMLLFLWSVANREPCRTIADAR